MGRSSLPILLKKSPFTTRKISSQQPADVLADRRHESKEWITEHDEKALTVLDIAIEIEPFLCIQIGGLRQDPFKMLPIKSTGMVPYAFDHFATVYAPFSARTAGFGTDFLPLWIGALMQDAMAFEAYLALALAIKCPAFDPNSPVSNAILKHSTNGMLALRQRLLSGTDATSDMVMLTIMVLSTVQYLAGNYEVSTVHQNALQHIVTLRGGLENLRGLRGYVRFRVTESLSAGATRIRQLRDPQRVPVKDSAASEISYPKHPYSPDLCRKITAFPPGFRELALSRKLSIQFIEHLHLVVKCDESDIRSDSMDLLDCTYGTTLERMLAIVVSAYTMFLERHITKRPPWLVSLIYLQRQTKLLISDPDIQSCDSKALAWSCLVLKATTESDTDLWKWADAKLHMMRVTEDKRRELEDDFLTISWLPEHEVLQL